ncbi:maltase 2 [Diachasma alloeum]|uniref:maltase 2 n=1 Tax=Diachasma alloeum TaxID=454923 RepID=UPI000738118F|nr:maltase 2 [Diachasma alloeum]
MMRLQSLIVFLITFNIVASEIKNVGWWKNAVFYQIYPRSFKDADNDGIGDLKGITSKLTHLKETGIDAVWLSSIYASPMVDSGYDVSDFRKIHPQYGNETDLIDLVKRAKELGIKLILDLIPNHTSDKHPWFERSLAGIEPFTNYYIWRNVTSDGKPPNNWLSVSGQSAWKCFPIRKKCYLHQFREEEPDLNYRNEGVRKEMVEIMKFWLAKGIDGFHISAAPHLFEIGDFRNEPRTNITGATDVDYSYLQHIYTKDQHETYELIRDWKKVLDDYANSTNTDEKVLMTEAYTTLKNSTKYYDSGVQVPSNFFFITDVNSTSSPDKFKSIIDAWLNETASRSGAVANWVMGTHDHSRIATRFPGHSDQMTMLAMILPGVAVIYYGEEIGMVDKSDITYGDTQDPIGHIAGPDNYKEYSRDPSRTPMQWDNSTNAGFNNGTKPWLPIHQNYVEINLAAQKVANNSHYDVYNKLIMLKKTRRAIISGTVQIFVSSDKKSLLVVRAAKNEAIILVSNLSKNETITVDVVSHVTSLNPTATVEVATLESPIKQGSSVNLRALKVAPQQSLVLSTKMNSTDELDSHKPPSKGGKKNASGTIALSSVLCVSVLLTALLELSH